MHFLPIITTLSLAVGSHAWANDGHGTWVANNKVYDWVAPAGFHQMWVHEACTIMNRNDVVYSNGESCAYWTDGQGGMFKGVCKSRNVGSSPVSLSVSCVQAETE